MELVNNTIFSTLEIERFVKEQFNREGFVLTQISDKHYKNRKLPEGKMLIDVQIGYPIADKKSGGKTKIKNIENMTLVLDIQ